MQDEILQGIDPGREVPVLPQLTGGHLSIDSLV